MQVLPAAEHVILRTCFLQSETWRSIKIPIRSFQFNFYFYIKWFISLILEVKYSTRILMQKRSSCPTVHHPTPAIIFLLPRGKHFQLLFWAASGRPFTVWATREVPSYFYFCKIWLSILLQILAFLKIVWIKKNYFFFQFCEDIDIQHYINLRCTT